MKETAVDGRVKNKKLKTGDKRRPNRRQDIPPRKERQFCPFHRRFSFFLHHYREPCDELTSHCAICSKKCQRSVFLRYYTSFLKPHLFQSINHGASVAKGCKKKNTLCRLFQKMIQDRLKLSLVKDNSHLLLILTRQGFSLKRLHKKPQVFFFPPETPDKPQLADRLCRKPSQQATHYTTCYLSHAALTSCSASLSLCKDMLLISLTECACTFTDVDNVVQTLQPR